MKKIRKVLEGGDILKVKEDRTFKILFNKLDKKALTWFTALFFYSFNNSSMLTML